MDGSAIASLISQVGFPIACCCVLFYSHTREQESHKQEMSAMVEAVNNNTIALTKLVDKIEKG